MVLHSTARRVKRCVCCVHRYYGIRKIRIKRKINTSIQYELVCRPALVGVIVHESTIAFTSQSVSWVVLCPLTTRLTPLYTTSPSVCPCILFFSLFSEAVKHNAHFISYVALVTSVCCLKAVMDAALVQCWSVHLQLGHLICPITVSKEDFITLRRSVLLEKRALSKRITFSDWISGDLYQGGVL